MNMFLVKIIPYSRLTIPLGSPYVRESTKVLDSGSQPLDSGSQHLDSGFQPSGFRIPNHCGFRILVSGFRISTAKICWIPDSGFRILLHGATWWLAIFWWLFREIYISANNVPRCKQNKGLLYLNRHMTLISYQTMFHFATSNYRFFTFDIKLAVTYTCT